MKIILMWLAAVALSMGGRGVARAERWDSKGYRNLPGGGRASVQVWAR